ncbi:MAG: SAM-dependent methyltransferase [Pseudonocardiales bacterium]
MSFDALLGTIQRLNVSVEALAALTAYLRLHTEDRDPGPEVAALLQTVVTELGIDAATIESIPESQLRRAVSIIRSFLRQADDLIDAPDRPPGWTYDDPELLQNQGHASMLVAGLVTRVAPTLRDLDTRLRADDARFLDVGTGVGLLAVAMCQAFPAIRVVGIDPWAPAMELARRNITDAGLTDRIELREQSVSDLAEEQTFDAAWIPAPFLPRDVMQVALKRTRTALRSGGWAFAGLYAAAPEPLPQALNALRIVRSGGHPWTPEETATLLERAGFADVTVIERTWSIPIQLVVGCAKL